MYPLVFSTEVSKALRDRSPLVALESTIIAHGMPWPQNTETALQVESIIREKGCVPATISVLKGKLCVGLERDQLMYLGSSKDIMKLSIRDLPFAISEKKNGATTVAATMRIASMAGIRIFVTGGTGGVHRDASRTMDISADLAEMSMTSVAVISAGIKSVLDIGHTLEYLETAGVPVVTVGQDELPGFYSTRSGFRSPYRLDSPVDIARLLKTKWEMGLQGSVLVANPVPENQEIPFSQMEQYIESALRAASSENIHGKALTPFLLKEIAKTTSGKSLEANIALVKNNAGTGAVIANELAKLQ